MRTKMKFIFTLCILLCATAVSAQTFPSATSCTSKDLSLVAATIPFSPCETCNAGDSIYKMLTVAINNKTGSTRTSFAFWATLVILNANGDTASKTAISRCFSTIPKNATTSYQYGNLGYKCGQSLILTDIWEAWTDASPGSTCPVLLANTSTINPKCGTNPKINIVGGVDANINITGATCITKGSITVSPFGGSGAPYAIALYNGTTKVDTASGIAAGGSKTFSNLDAATYTIKLYDKNNCPNPVMKTRNLESSSAPSVSGIGGAFTKTCTQNTSGATIGESPVSGYSYSWSPTTGLSNANIGNPTANPSSTTTYTVTKTDNTTGCSNTANVTVTVNTTQPSVSGIGGAFTKTCSQNTSGATIGETPVSGYSYSWSPTTGLSNANIGNPTANPSSTTTYTVTKTDNVNGCSNTANVTVTVNTTQPSVSGIGGAFTKTCTQNTSGATIGESPVSGYSYSWSPTTGLSNANIGNPTANPSSTTTYTVTKTDNTTGCSNTANVTVTVNTTQPSVSGIGGAFTKTCSQNTSGATIGETPVSGYSYSWSPTTGLSNANIGNPTANPSSTTTYTVTKTDNVNGCSNTANVTVTVNTAAPTFTVCLVQPTLCANSGSVTINASGGSGFQYSIDNGAHYQSGNTFTGLASGSVSGIIVTNSDGCASNPAACDVASDCSQQGITNRQSNLTPDLLATNDIAVKAYPNPFNDQVKFMVNSPKAGNGSLEVYNLLGQRIKTVYQGHINAGDQYFELSLPKKQQASLIYIFRVGDKKVTGKLLQLNN